MTYGIKASEEGYDVKSCGERHLTIGETERYKILDNSVYYTTVNVSAYSASCCEEIIFTWNLPLNYLCPILMFYYRDDQNRVYPINHNFRCYNCETGEDERRQIVRLILDSSTQERKIYYAHGVYDGTSWSDSAHTLKFFCLYSENYLSAL